MSTTPAKLKPIALLEAVLRPPIHNAKVYTKKKPGPAIWITVPDYRSVSLTITLQSRHVGAVDAHIRHTLIASSSERGTTHHKTLLQLRFA